MRCRPQGHPSIVAVLPSARTTRTDKEYPRFLGLRAVVVDHNPASSWQHVAPSDPASGRTPDSAVLHASTVLYSEARTDYAVCRYGEERTVLCSAFRRTVQFEFVTDNLRFISRRPNSQRAASGVTRTRRCKEASGVKAGVFMLRVGVANSSVRVDSQDAKTNPCV